MKSTVLQKVDPTTPPREVIVGYGPPAAGKTRLFTSLPERFGKIAYLAIDEGSENLDSVLPQYRERLTVFKPVMKSPVVDSSAISMTDWKKEGYDTLLLDTFTNLTHLWLHEVVQSGAFQENRKMIGKPGEEGMVAIADRGHYGGVQSIIRNFMVTVFRHNPNTHLIFLCHEKVKEVKEGESTRAVLGGPETTGTAMLNEFPSIFKTVIRVTSEAGAPQKVDGKIVTPQKFVARMSQHGIYIARRNEASLTGNPIKKVDLDVDPINFWNLLEAQHA